MTASQAIIYVIAKFITRFFPGSEDAHSIHPNPRFDVESSDSDIVRVDLPPIQ